MEEVDLGWSFGGPVALNDQPVTGTGSSGWDFGINLVNAAARSYQAFTASQSPFGSPYALGAGSGCPPGFYLPTPGSRCTPVPGSATVTNLAGYLPLLLIAGGIILAIVLIKK